MYLIIELCEFDIDNGGLDEDYKVLESGVYTEKIATFMFERQAMEYVKDKPHLMIVDCEEDEILDPATWTTKI